MHITINEGPDNRISIMQGQQLAVNNEGDAITIKVSTPLNNSYTGVIHLTPAETNWLLRTLPNLKNTSGGSSVFLDRSIANRIAHSTIKAMMGKMMPLEPSAGF